jgi:hypothetical protein
MKVPSKSMKMNQKGIVKPQGTQPAKECVHRGDDFWFVHAKQQQQNALLCKSSIDCLCSHDSGNETRQRQKSMFAEKLCQCDKNQLKPTTQSRKRKWLTADNCLLMRVSASPSTFILPDGKTNLSLLLKDSKEIAVHHKIQGFLPDRNLNNQRWI